MGVQEKEKLLLLTSNDRISEDELEWKGFFQVKTWKCIPCGVNSMSQGMVVARSINYILWSFHSVQYTLDSSLNLSFITPSISRLQEGIIIIHAQLRKHKHIVSKQGTGKSLNRKFLTKTPGVQLTIAAIVSTSLVQLHRVNTQNSSDFFCCIVLLTSAFIEKTGNM